MSNVDTDWVLRWLQDNGYRYAVRTDGWVECFVWHQDERWTGRGPTREDAVRDVLRRMFPSAASRTLLQHTISAALPGVTAVFNGPPKPDYEPSSNAGLSPDTASPSSAGRHYVSAYSGPDPETVLADVGLLDELIDSKRPELALMTPSRQRLSILSWICQARAAQGQAGSHSRVVTAVTHIARKLTLLSKRWWPGSVLSLQLDATPFHVGRELDLARADWPRDWTEAADCAETRLRELVSRELQGDCDPFGWPSGDVRIPRPAAPDTILDQVRAQLERFAGPLDQKPPNRASEGIRRPVQEMLERQHYWARLARWTRGYVSDYVAWGALMGRLRWMSTQASRRDDVLLELLSPDFVPEGSWQVTTEHAASDDAAERRRTQVLRRATILKNVDLDAMLMWLFDAFDVLDSAAITRQLAPFQQQILQINPDELTDVEPVKRQRLVEVQSRLAAMRTNDVASTGGGAAWRNEKPLTVYPSADDGFDPFAGIREAIGTHTHNMVALIVGDGATLATVDAIRDAFGFSAVELLDMRTATQETLHETLARVEPQFLLSATGFFSHRFDLDLIRACRRSDVLHVRAHQGGIDTVTVALARHLGLIRTTAAL